MAEKCQYSHSLSNFGPNFCQMLFIFLPCMCGGGGGSGSWCISDVNCPGRLGWMYLQEASAELQGRLFEPLHIHHFDFLVRRVPFQPFEELRAQVISSSDLTGRFSVTGLERKGTRGTFKQLNKVGTWAPLRTKI